MTTKNLLDLRDRRHTFTDLEAKVFDVLIIGAGITGCGVARDVVHDELEEESVELRRRQRVGARQIEGVLGRDDEEEIV